MYWIFLADISDISESVMGIVLSYFFPPEEASWPVQVVVETPEKVQEVPPPAPPTPAPAPVPVLEPEYEVVEEVHEPATSLEDNGFEVIADRTGDGAKLAYVEALASAAPAPAVESKAGQEKEQEEARSSRPAYRRWP